MILYAHELTFRNRAWAFGHQWLNWMVDSQGGDTPGLAPLLRWAFAEWQHLQRFTEPPLEEWELLP